MPEYIKGQTGYSDGAGGTISYGHQFGNGGRTASTVVDPSRGLIMVLVMLLILVL